MTLGFHIENFGCRAARADGEALGDRLRNARMSETPAGRADLVVVNTCSVTAEADREARAYIRKVHRLNPAARILVTGCYAQRAPQEVSALDGVAAVVGNSHKALAPEIALGLVRPTENASPHAPQTLVPVQSLLAGAGTDRAPIFADDRFAHAFLEEAQVLPGAQTRPNLKIQEGCGNRCTFCVIPQTRGNSRSLPAEKVLDQVNGFVAAGGKELVLSGINLGRWGRDLAGEARQPLAALVRRIFAETELPRLRLSSIEPMDWDADLIGLLREFGGTRLARHAHLPLQSGSDAVLRRMHRRYRPWHYADRVEALLKAAGPALTLGADVMAGFPGETDAEFRETRDLIRELPFGYLHLFPFSPRPGTPGEMLHVTSPVPESRVRERMAELRELAQEKTRRHRAQFVSKQLPAVILHTPAEVRSRNASSALTENFLPVEIEGVHPPNSLVIFHAARIGSDFVLSGEAL